MRQKGYSNKEVADLLKMKAGTVAYYTNKGFVEPEIENPKGRGTTRRYSRKNLIEFMLILELQQHGLSLSKVMEVLRQAKIAPSEYFESVTGKQCKQSDFNPWDGLDFNNPFIRLGAEVFIIIYDDDKDLLVEFRVLPEKKTDDKLVVLSREEIKSEIKRFLQFSVDMHAHNSAIIINVSELWKTAMGL